MLWKPTYSFNNNFSFKFDRDLEMSEGQCYAFTAYSCIINLTNYVLLAWSLQMRMQ